MGTILQIAARLLSPAHLLSRARHPGASPVPTLSAREAYRRWASTYQEETALSALDEELATAMLQGLPRTRLLDAGCGTGRRIQAIPEAIGIDLSPEMLAAASAKNVIPGDVRQIPFSSCSFDMVWCRLVLGHLPDAAPAYYELARVSAPGGHVFVTDFHPDAALAGHRRTGHDEQGSFGIEHYTYTDHVALARQAGLVCLANRCGHVGPSVRQFYLQGLGEKTYRRDLGLRILNAYLFYKPSTYASAVRG